MNDQQAPIKNNRLKACAVAIQSSQTNAARCGLLLTLCTVLFGCATPVGQVQRWQISGVEVAEFSGQVVDILCEVSGNCAERCGKGSRQLGLKTDDEIVLIAKDLNRYTGASQELWPHCGRQLVVNGQYTETGGSRFFQIQNVREPGGSWMSTTKFLENWAQQNDAPVSSAKNWYRTDERVKTILEQDGLLGLGPGVNP
jgi:hypothetical protein